MLIAGGDSWSCWPQEELYGSRDKCWPAIVSKKLGHTLIDHSRAGCSNDRIFRYCLPAALEWSPAIVVVFWSCSDRFEIGLHGKIQQVMPAQSNNTICKQYIAENLDLYLQYCNTLLKILSLQETCKQRSSTLLQKFCFKADCWWDGTIEQFKLFLRDAGTFDHLSDDMIEEKFQYLLTLHNQIDAANWIGPIQEPLQNLIEVNEEFSNHPTDNGHIQMANLILAKLNENIANKNIK